MVAACQHLDTRQQFLAACRFDQIVVGTAAQRQHDVLFCVVGGDKDHGGIVKLPVAQPFEQFDTTDPGKPPVKQQYLILAR